MCLEELASLPLFASLTPPQLELLGREAVSIPCARGTVFFLEGERAKGLYFLLAGKVKIFRVAPDGKETVLHVFGPGEPFGEVAVFQGGSFPASASCEESGRAIFLPREALLKAIARDPGLALNLLAALSLRLRSFVSKVETLTVMETPQRLAAYLLLASEEQGKDSIRLDVSKTLLAGILGTARETLSRCLARLAEQEAVRVEGRTVHLLDKPFLRALAKGMENL